MLKQNNVSSKFTLKQGAIAVAAALSLTAMIASAAQAQDLMSLKKPAKTAHVNTSPSQKRVVAYFLTGAKNSWSNFKSMINNPSQYPYTRLVLSFVKPRVQLSGDTTQGSGLYFVKDDGSRYYPTLTELNTMIQTVRQQGKEVYISVGGWDYSNGGDGNTYPNVDKTRGNDNDSQYYNSQTGSDNGYMYFQSLLLYPKSANYPIDQNGKCLKGAAIGQTPSMDNFWCYVIEPKSNGSTAADFSSFPYPQNFPSADLPQGVKADTTPYYQNLVAFAKKIGVDGIDLDYEEFPNADWYRQTYVVGGPVPSSIGEPNHAPGGKNPFVMPRTVEKFSYILKTLEDAIDAANQQGGNTLSLSMAAPAVGAIPIKGKWGTGEQWWGGNLKGLIYNTSQFNQNGINGSQLLQKVNGGIGVMTYDLSSSKIESPFSSQDWGPLKDQIGLYMNSYKTMLGPIVGMQNLMFGIETQTPAYPAVGLNGTDGGFSLPVYTPNSNVVCGGVAGGCDLNQVIPQGSTQLPAVPKEFKSVRYVDQSGLFTPSEFGGAIMWEQFKDKPAAADQNMNKEKYAKPLAIENYLKTVLGN